MKRLPIALLGALLCCALLLPMAGQAQSTGVLTRTTSFGSGSHSGPVLTMDGHSTCSIKTTGGTSGYTVTVKGSEVPGTFETLTQFGSSGVISSDNTYTANIVSGTASALSQFTYTLVGPSSGTLIVTETCSKAIGGTAALNGSVTFTNPTPSPTPVAVASAGLAAPPNSQSVIAFNECTVPAGATPNVTGGNFIAAQCQSNGARNVHVVNSPNVTVLNPQPLPTLSPDPGVLTIGSGSQILSKDVNLSTTGIDIVTLVADASGSKTIYVRAIALQFAGVTMATLVGGTKTTSDCDTAKHVIYRFHPIDGTFYAVGNGSGVLAKTAAGEQVCLETTAGTGPSAYGTVTVTQQ